LLPVELTRLEAHLRQRDILLSWETQTEKNNAYFSVERSADGRHFSEIGSVAGAGTTSVRHLYTYTDPLPAPGKYYYRLRQVDFDGTYQYSPMVSVSISGISHVQLYPSPATDMLNIALEDVKDERYWQVFDAGGRLLEAGTLAPRTISLEVSVTHWPEGVYLFRLSGGPKPFVQRFYKK
jgi:hypothetical protein